MIQQQDEVFKPLILEIFEKSGRRFGARKLRAKLVEKDYIVSERRIIRFEAVSFFVLVAEMPHLYKLKCLQ